MDKTRRILNTLKIKMGLTTDKALAEEMGVTYGALTNWISRDAIQYEPVIEFALKNSIDLNELFGGKTNTFDISSPEMDGHILKLIHDKFMYYAENGGRLLTLPFSDSIKEIIDDYDQKVEKIREALKT